MSTASSSVWTRLKAQAVRMVRHIRRRQSCCRCPGHGARRAEPNGRGAVVERLDGWFAVARPGCRGGPIGSVPIAGKTEDGFRVIEVWDSPEHIERFMGSGHAQAMQEAQIPEPTITEFEVHKLVWVRG